jgi:hypothetical protein
MTRIGSLYAPRVIAAAAGIPPDVLRQWSNAHGAIPEPLAFLGEMTPGGRRRYSVADAALVQLVVTLGNYGVGPARAVPAANALAGFVRELDARFAPDGADALVAMAAAGPVAVLAAGTWPARWTVAAFPDRAAYTAAQHLPALALRLDMAALFQTAAVAVTRGAVAIIHGDDE